MTRTGTEIAADHAWEIAWKQSVVRPPHEQAAWLLDTIGPRFTTAGVGLSDARTVKRWVAEATGPREHDVERRLALLFRVTHAVTDVYGPASVAAAFLRSANPQLDDQSPLALIAKVTDETAEAPILAATRAFLEG